MSPFFYLSSQFIAASVQYIDEIVYFRFIEITKQMFLAQIQYESNNLSDISYSQLICCQNSIYTYQIRTQVQIDFH